MTISFLLLLAVGVGVLVIVILGLALLGVMVARRLASRPAGAGLSADKTEAAVSLIAALFVLFSALLNPLLSAGLAIVFLLAMAIYKLLPQRQGR